MFKFYSSYIRRLTIKRGVNILCIYLGYQLSLLFRKPIICGLPWGISIEPTYLCNLKCPECPTGMGEIQRKNKQFPFLKYQSIIDQVYKKSMHIQLFLQGEPFLNKSIDKFISYANSKNLYTSISTNGHYLNQEMAYKIVRSGLDKLIISMDGMDQETYEKYRVNGNLDKVINGIEWINEAKKKHNSTYPLIELQFIVFRHNEHQIEDFKLHFNPFADKITIKSAQIYNAEKKEHLIPNQNKYSRYIKKNNTIRMKREIKNRCFKIWYTSDISTDGDILPCCYDKFATFKLGNAFDSSFESTWHGEKAKIFRKTVLSNQNEIEICNNCDG